MNNRERTINSLKGIAILGIVLVHYGCDSGYSVINSIVGNGARGVQLLFVINGYLIFYSLDKIELTRKNVINWWKNKFIRIIPMYWFFTLLHLFVVGLGPRYYLGPHDHVSGLNIFCNLFLLHNFYPYYNCINANWFMGVIGVFYILAPFLKRIINSLERAICMLCMILPMGYVAMHILITNYYGEYLNIWLDYVQILSFPSEFPCICIGIIIFFLEKNGMLSSVKNKRLFSYSLLLLVLWGLASLILNKHIFVVGNNISTIGVIFGLLFIGQLICPLRIVCNKFFAYIGKHSYGIYLSHILFMEFINEHVELESTIGIRWGLGYCVVVVGAMIISVILERILEQNKLIQCLYQKRI